MKTILLLLILPILVFSSTLIRKYETGETFDFAENDMIEDIQNQIKNNKPQIEAKIEE
jgi:conjugal transfer pilus assembly protein TraW